MNIKMLHSDHWTLTPKWTAGKRAAATLMDLEPEDPGFCSEIGDFETATWFQEVAVAERLE